MPFSNLTQPDNPLHLQLRSKVPQYHKEKLINLAVQQLLPKKWKAMAWVEGDVVFIGNPNWASDALRLLSKFDTVQLFSHTMDVDDRGIAVKYYAGFGYHHTHGHPFGTKDFDWWHPGYGWAWSRRAYDAIGGKLFEGNVYGGGALVQAWSLTGFHSNPPPTNESFRYVSQPYQKSILEHESRVVSAKAGGMKVGYVPGVVQRNQAFQDELESIGGPLKEAETLLQRHDIDPKKYEKSFPLSTMSPPKPQSPRQEKGEKQGNSHDTLVIATGRLPQQPVGHAFTRLAILVPYSIDQEDEVLASLSRWAGVGSACTPSDTKSRVSLFFYSPLSSSAAGVANPHGRLDDAIMRCFDSVETIFAGLTLEEAEQPSGKDRKYT